jgi:voltage-gated potassium channel
MRKRLFEIIEVSSDNDRLSSIYDYSMIVIIVVSLIPLAFKESNVFFDALDIFAVSIFIVDYLARFITADLKLKKKSAAAFVRYPFSFMAIIDLISILPSLIVVNNSLRLLRVLRMARAFRVFRVFKAMRYSKSVVIILGVFNRSKESLTAVASLAASFILIMALIIFNVEPDSFVNFFEALYWATVSLTTMGYGDIYPVTEAGRIVTMISSIFGIAVIALPAGILTAGYLNEIEAETQKMKDKISDSIENFSSNLNDNNH